MGKPEEIKENNLEYAQEQIDKACIEKNKAKALLAARLWVRIKYEEFLKK